MAEDLKKIKMVAHVSGLDLVSQCLRDLEAAAKKMGEALDALSVRVEVQ